MLIKGKISSYYRSAKDAVVGRMLVSPARFISSSTKTPEIKRSVSLIEAIKAQVFNNIVFSRSSEVIKKNLQIFEILSKLK